MKFVVIEQAEDNEAYITKCNNKEDAENTSIIGGNCVIVTYEAYKRMCKSGATL